MYIYLDIQIWRLNDENLESDTRMHQIPMYASWNLWRKFFIRVLYAYWTTSKPFISMLYLYLTTSKPFVRVLYVYLTIFKLFTPSNA